MDLRIRLSLNPGNGIETGPRDAYCFISNSPLNAFTNDLDDIKVEQRTMGEISLTQ